MCGRYYLEIDEIDLREIISEVERKQQERYEQLTIKLGGEIFPTDIVPVQSGIGEYQPMQWGFTSFDGKPIINARSETAQIKSMFKEPMLKNRCLIPASGYFEWQREGKLKTKYQFFVPDQTLFLAGCYRQEKNSPIPKFVILTRDAVNGLEVIHNRMPVIIPQSHIETWLNDNPDAIAEAITKLSFDKVS